MTTTCHIALLRAINVGRAKRMAVADLRASIEGLGYGGVRTLLNSGNVVFSATVTSVGADSKTWTFSVAGGLTGPDGEGTSDQHFRSKSGRVEIAPENWFRGFGKEPVPKGYTIRRHVVPRFTANFAAPGKARGPGIEPAVTAIQGIPNTRHVL